MPDPHKHYVPELRESLECYGVKLHENPPYVLFGTYRSKALGRVQGILAAASNEFHAHLMRREFLKAGRVEVMCTEYHPVHHDFSIAEYREKVRSSRERKASATTPEQEADVVEPTKGGDPSLRMLDQLVLDVAFAALKRFQTRQIRVWFAMVGVRAWRCIIINTDNSERLATGPLCATPEDCLVAMHRQLTTAPQGGRQ